eukprot:4433952-Prymnesium_polylepis.1
MRGASSGAGASSAAPPETRLRYVRGGLSPPRQPDAIEESGHGGVADGRGAGCGGSRDACAARHPTVEHGRISASHPTGSESL